jgi:hypothetical protein
MPQGTPHAQAAMPQPQPQPQQQQTRDSSPPIQTFFGHVSSDAFERAPSEQAPPAPNTRGQDGSNWFPFSVATTLHQVRAILNHPGNAECDQSRRDWDSFATQVLSNVFEAFDNIQGDVPTGTRFVHTEATLRDGARLLLGLVPFEKLREDLMIEERFDRLHNDIHASHAALNASIQTLATGLANLGTHVMAQTPVNGQAPRGYAGPAPPPAPAPPRQEDRPAEDPVPMDTRTETRPQAQAPGPAQAPPREPSAVPTPATNASQAAPASKGKDKGKGKEQAPTPPAPPPKDSRYVRAPTGPSNKAETSPLKGTSDPAPSPKLNKTQRAQHQSVPGSAEAIQAKSYAAAASNETQPEVGGPWTEAKAKTKRAQQHQQPAKPSTTATPRAALYTKFTIHFTHGKPKPDSITAGRCHNVWNRIHDELSVNPVAKASGAALIKGLTMSRGGNIIAEWPAHVKASAVIAMRETIQRAVADEFGLFCQLESDEAWTRFVVENAPARDEAGDLPSTVQLVAPIFESGLFDGLPKQVMEGPRWLVKRDSAIPPAASFQVAVLDPEGTVRTRFARFAFNGKVDVFYAGRKCKMRLFVQKEIFSQCTMCWRHGHSKGDSACKARKELCTRCGDAHRTQVHDQACVKCHGLNRKECECAPRCVNCQGAHKSDDATCPGRLKFRDPRRVPPGGNASGVRGSFRGGHGGRPGPTGPDIDKATPVHWVDQATTQEWSEGYAQFNEMLAREANPGQGWGEPGPSKKKRAPAVPSTSVEGVSASIHAPANEQKSAHVSFRVDDTDDGMTSEDDEEPAAVRLARAESEKRRKAAIAQAAEAAAPLPPDPDTRMGSSPMKTPPQPLPKPKTGKKSKILATIGNGRFMGGPDDPHVISSRETDPIMQARQQAFADMANSQEVAHPPEMLGVLGRLHAGLPPPEAAAVEASQSSVPAPSSSYPVPHIDLAQFPYLSTASTSYTSMPSSLVAALPSNPPQ